MLCLTSLLSVCSFGLSGSIEKFRLSKVTFEFFSIASFEALSVSPSQKKIYFFRQVNDRNIFHLASRATSSKAALKFDLVGRTLPVLPDVCQQIDFYFVRPIRIFCRIEQAVCAGT
jgi:hypothetical protein